MFITAPNTVPPLETQSSEDGADISHGAAGWWYSRQDNYFDAHEQTGCCKGYEQSLQLIMETIKEQGPFDGILGFSQGASMVSLLCGLQEQQAEMWFKFAILVAGFKSKSTPHDVLYSQKISVPTLHVFGNTDKVIEKEMSEDLLQYFEDAITLEHPGGHFIPAGGPQRKVYLEFLDKILAKKDFLPDALLT